MGNVYFICLRLIEGEFRVLRSWCNYSMDDTFLVKDENSFSVAQPLRVSPVEGPWSLLLSRLTPPALRTASTDRYLSHQEDHNCALSTSCILHQDTSTPNRQRIVGLPCASAAEHPGALFSSSCDVSSSAALHCYHRHSGFFSHWSPPDCSVQPAPSHFLLETSFLVLISRKTYHQQHYVNKVPIPAPSASKLRRNDNKPHRRCQKHLRQYTQATR